jgi:DNA-binding FadR family transcriptional regulator
MLKCPNNLNNPINQTNRHRQKMTQLQLSSEFLRYLAHNGQGEAQDAGRIPPLTALSKQLKVSVASLREQLEVAKAMGLVDVRPRTGIRCLPYSFLPTVRESLAYALELERSYFTDFSELRNHIEAAYWHQAVQSLTSEDHQALQRLIAAAWEKLRGRPVQIPHQEHRLLHMTIFGRLENVFAQGILEAYWDAYETTGLNVFADYDYLQQVWQYHQEMVEAIVQGDFEAGFTALVEHKKLLSHRPNLARESQNGS